MKIKRFVDQKITTPTTTDNSLSASINWYGDSNFCLSFKVSCLKEKNAIFTPASRIFFFIVYELDTWSRDSNSDFISKDCLFGDVKLPKNADPDKQLYSGYSNEFDSCSEYSLLEGSIGKNVIIVGVDMSSSLHIDDKKRDILILGRGPIQGLDDTTLTAEAKYSFN